MFQTTNQILVLFNGGFPKSWGYPKSWKLEPALKPVTWDPLSLQKPPSEVATGFFITLPDFPTF